MHSATLIIGGSFAGQLTASTSKLTKPFQPPAVGKGLAPDAICLDAEGAIWAGAADVRPATRRNDSPAGPSVQIHEGGEVLARVEHDRPIYGWRVGRARSATISSSLPSGRAQKRLSIWRPLAPGRGAGRWSGQWPALGGRSPGSEFVRQHPAGRRTSPFRISCTSVGRLRGTSARECSAIRSGPIGTEWQWGDRSLTPHLKSGEFRSEPRSVRLCDTTIHLARIHLCGQLRVADRPIER